MKAVVNFQVYFFSVRDLTNLILMIVMTTNSRWKTSENTNVAIKPDTSIGPIYIICISNYLSRIIT